MGCAHFRQPSELPDANDEFTVWLKRGLCFARDVDDGFARDGTLLAFACEGEVFRLPGNGAVEELISAIYGDALDLDGGLNVTEAVARRLQGAVAAGGFMEMPLSASSFLGGSVSHGALRVRYRPAVEPILVEVPEHRQLPLQPDLVEAVAEAKFGAGDAWTDVRARVARQLLEGRGVLARADALGCGPAPGAARVLRVRYVPRQHLAYKVDASTVEGAIQMEPLTPWYFRKVRELSGVDHKEYWKAIGTVGKSDKVMHRASGSSLYFTACDRFVLKTISAAEMASLMAIMPGYLEHLKADPGSFLPRYLGAYRLRRPDGVKIHTVCVRSAFASSVPMDYIFDLKGNPEGVGADVNKCQILNDGNFGSMTLHLEDDKIQGVLQRLKSDSQFLEAYDLTEYSLLVGIRYCADPRSAALRGTRGVSTRGTTARLSALRPGRRSNASYEPTLLTNRGAPQGPRCCIRESRDTVPTTGSARPTGVGGALAPGGQRGSALPAGLGGLLSVPMATRTNRTVGQSSGVPFAVAQDPNELKAIQSSGVLQGLSIDAVVRFGVADALVAHGIRRPKLRGGDSDAAPASAFGQRFRDFCVRKLRSVSEHISVTPVSPDVELPLSPVAYAGNPNLYYRVRYKDSAQGEKAKLSREYWVAKDLGKANGEVLFYEASRKWVNTPSWEFLRWLVPYGGVLRAACQKKEGKLPEQANLMLLRNLSDGFACCRMLYIRIGAKTALSGWRGKSAWTAFRQTCQDAVTQSGCQGFRLDWFLEPPTALMAVEEIMRFRMKSVDKQLFRFYLNRMEGMDFLPFFLDLHSVAGGAVPAGKTKDPGVLTSVEHQELVLLTIIEELSNFVNACRKVPVPQMWIGSTVAVAFDCRARLARGAALGHRRPGDIVRLHLCDWGKSELNTPTNHALLGAKSQAQRQHFWGDYCGGIARLLYDCCALYVGWFWRKPGSLAFSLWDKDRYSDDDFIGCVIAPTKVAYEEQQVLKNTSGNIVKSGRFSGKDTRLEYSVKSQDLPATTRLEDMWVVRIERAFNVPQMDLASAADTYVEVKALAEDPESAQEAWRGQPKVLKRMLHECSHSTTVQINTNEPFWGEEFQIAILKKESRMDFLRALSVALDHPADEAEVAALFPGAAAENEAAEHAALQRGFAQRCFPEIKIKIGAEGKIMTKFPEDDLMRLLHFGEWLSKETDGRDLVFVLFFIACARGALERLPTVRFSEAFVLAGPAQNWVQQVQASAKALSADDDASLRSSRKLLAQVAKEELKSNWLAYTLRNEEADFYTWDGGPPEVARTASRIEKQPRGRVGKKRSSAAAGPAHRSSLVWSAAPTATGKLATAVPLIYCALLREAKCVDTLIDSASRALGNPKALQFLRSHEGVGRCRYVLPAGGCKYAPTPGGEALPFEAIGTEAFSQFRRSVCGISDEVVLSELADGARPLQGVATNSKSGALFLASATGRFVVKTLSEGEAKLLEEMLPSYVAHHTSARPTLLGQYVGLFKVGMGHGHGERYVSVMRSVFDCPQQVGLAIYDLKGSTYHRAAKEVEAVRKDQDWRADGRCLRVSQADRSRILEAHQRDCDFLISFNVMDFSLLIGCVAGDANSSTSGAWVSEDRSECYLLGIVDFLVGYGLQKKAEHLVHELRGHGEDASVMTPVAYAQRQRAFLREAILRIDGDGG